MVNRVLLDAYLPATVESLMAGLVEVGEDSGLADLFVPGGGLHVGQVVQVVAHVRPERTVRFSATLAAIQGQRLTLSFPEGSITTMLSALRKGSHLDVVRRQAVEATTSAGLDSVHLRHCAMPELAESDVDTSIALLGKSLRAPLVIAGMTGGSEGGKRVNAVLAEVAEAHGFALGVGSQRAMMEDSNLAPTFEVRTRAPSTLVLANLGAVQLLRGGSVDAVRHLVEAVGADALCLHLNVLQELVQPEGDRAFAGVRSAIERLIPAIGVPVVLKETGAGLDDDTARWAASVGIAALDVGGLGGTAWGYIEGLRSASPEDRTVGETFRNWGRPTRDAVIGCHRAAPTLPIIATGGLRSGLDVAKALAIGATAGGMALPFFRAAEQGEAAAHRLAERLVRELKIAMLCAAARNVAQLPGALDGDVGASE